MVARLTCRGQGLALFTGDAEKPVLRRLLRAGRDLRAAVLVAPHHGSDNSFLAAFYRAVQPRLVLAACGFENRYGYPGRRLRAWLQHEAIPLLDTGRHGGAQDSRRLWQAPPCPTPQKCRTANVYSC